MEPDGGDGDLDMGRTDSSVKGAGAQTGGTWKKHRYALIFGYLGTGYYGLQYQKTVPTVEAEIIKALVTAGFVEAENAVPKKMGLSRCGRTDKGVHAVGQVITLKMRVPKDATYEWLRDKLNAVLPPAIRIFHVQRTIGSFHARFMCSGRRYQYLIPAFALLPPNATAGHLPLPWAPTSNARRAEASPAGAGAGAGASGEAGAGAGTGAGAGAGGAGASGEAGTCASGETSGEAAAGASVDACTLPDKYQTGAAQRLGWLRGGSLRKLPWWTAPLPTSTHAAGTAAEAQAAAAQPDRWQTGAAFQIGRRRRWKAQATASRSAIEAYRIPPSTVARLRAALRKYLGRHSFHNFSPKAAFGDDSAVRVMTRCDCSDPFLVGDMQFVVVTLRGESFMLNQIRKMMGIVMDVARGAAPLSAMDTALTGAFVSVPLAPATGLYLHTAFFDHLLKKRRSDNPWGPLDCDIPEAATRRQAFLDDVLWPHIASQVLEQRTFHDLVDLRRQKPLAYRDRGVDPVRLAKHKQRLAREKASERAFVQARAQEKNRGPASEDKTEQQPKASRGFRPWVPPGQKKQLTARERGRKRYRVGRRKGRGNKHKKQRVKE